MRDVYYYIQGNLRYRLYYSKFAFLIRKHIREQIEYRINSMDKECYERGECHMCGCATTQLQMSNKSCKKYCYPSILSKKKWEALKDKKNTHIFIADEKLWAIDNSKKQFKLIGR